jgi:hypothetical protein
MKYIIIVLFALFLSQPQALTRPVFAQQTPSPVTKSATGSAQVNPLLEKINAIKKEAASKAAELKNVVINKLQNKVYVGKILNIEGSKITLQGRSSQKIVLVNEYSAYEDKANPKSKLDLDNLEPNEYLATLGDVDDKNQLTAKKLVLIKAPSSSAKEVIWGQVQKINANQIELLANDGKLLTVTSSGQTEIRLGSEEATLKDITQNKIIVATGKLNGDKLNAEYIYIGSRGGTIKPIKNTATPSATKN